MTISLKEVPLKELDQAGLAEAILTATAGFDRAYSIADALETATFLHRNQTRANRGNQPRTPYIEHPLRNALRLLRWGVTDPDLIIAALLHDTVEDCAEDIVKILLGGGPATFPHTPDMMQKNALEWVGTYGRRAARLVGAVTNPPAPEGLTKAERNQLYVRFVAEHIFNDAAVFLIKFTDYVDNALGLHHNNVAPNKAMVAKLAAKYLPLADVFEAELVRNNAAIRALLSEHGYAEVERQVLAARGRLENLIGSGH